MSFALPLAFWGMLAVPCLIAIYLFRRRLKTRVTSALFLWQSPGFSLSSGRRISRLESSLLLLLELIMLLLLVIAAAAPGCFRQRSVYHLTVLLDDSASMAAAMPGELSPRDKAADFILKHLDENAPFSCALVLSGSSPALLAPKTSNPRDIREALKLWSPAKPFHDFAPGLRLARQLAGENTEVIFLTDHAPPSSEDKHPKPPPGVIWHAFGKPSDNAAFVFAARNFDPVSGDEELFMVISNFGDTPLESDLVVRNEAEKLVTRTISVGRRTTEKISIRIASATDIPLSVDINSKDAMRTDNSLLLVPEKTLPLRIIVNFENNKRMAELINFTLASMANSITRVEDRPELVLSDDKEFIRSCNELFPDAWTLQVNPDNNENQSSAKSARPRVYTGPYTIAKDHDVCENLSLSGVRWAADREQEGQETPPLLPLVSAGNQTLLGESPKESERGPRHFTMNFMPERSNVQKTPAWPIMMHNIVRAARNARQGFNTRNLIVGYPATMNMPEPPLAGSGRTETQIKVKKMTADPEAAEQDRAFITRADKWVFIPDKKGVFEVSAPGASPNVISANFISPDESDILSSTSGIWGQQPVAQAMAKPAWRDEAWIFLLAALAVALIHIAIVKHRESLA